MAHRFFSFPLVLSFIFLVSGCRSQTDKSIEENPDDAKTEISTWKAVREFPANQHFFTYVRKSVAFGESIYSLFFFKQNAESPFSSAMLAHSTNGVELPSPKLPDQVKLLDFDFSPSGRLIQLGYEITDETLDDFNLKELSVFIDSKKAFTFFDSKQDLAVRYDETGKTSASKPFVPNRTLFFTTRESTWFARVRATEDKIWISAFGQFGIKLFCFDFSGRELGQVELIPLTSFSGLLVDSDAPEFDIGNDRVIAVVHINKLDSPIVKSHLGIDLKWEGAEYQAFVQSFDFNLNKKTKRLLFTPENFLGPKVSVGDDRFVVFGSVGGAGTRKAKAIVLGYDFNDQFQTEFSLENETEITAATFYKNRLLVAGGTGSIQVSTGSVVSPANLFVAEIPPGGTVKPILRFGSERNDGATSLIEIGSSVFISGYKDGPITHTADEDKSQGYQNWFIGRLE